MGLSGDPRSCGPVVCFHMCPYIYSNNFNQYFTGEQLTLPTEFYTLGSLARPFPSGAWPLPIGHRGCSRHSSQNESAITSLTLETENTLWGT